MTAQTAEILILDGRAEILHSLPLGPYLQATGTDIKALAAYESTALYRGYIGVWEILDGTLFLVGLFDTRSTPLDPASVFGGRRFPIEDEWFSGCLSVDRGDLLTYMHFGWTSLSPQRLRLYIEQGRLVRRRCDDQTKLLKRRLAITQQNYEEFRQAPLDDAASPTGPLGGFTAAGLRVLGYPPFEGEPVWPGNDGDLGSCEWVQAMLEQCVRPGVTPAC